MWVILHYRKVLLYTVVLFYNPIGQVLWNKCQYSTLEHGFYKQCSTVEHDFYKLTTTIKVVRSNHYCYSQAWILLQISLLGGVEGGVCSVTCHFAVWMHWQSIDSNEGVPKVASLFECHLNIDPVSLFESEGANQSWTINRKHELATSLTLPSNPLLASNVVVLECMQVLAKFGLIWWLFIADLGLASFLTSKPWNNFLCKHNEYNKQIVHFHCFRYQVYYYLRNGNISRVVINLDM